MNWFVYHSQSRMGHSYESLGKSAVYSTKKRPKLCLGDLIWVVEGSADKSKTFTLVDAFEVASMDFPPFGGAYEAMALRLEGNKSLLMAPVSLDRSMPWFVDLHDRFIKKRTFFAALNAYPQITDGFRTAAGIHN